MRIIGLDVGEKRIGVAKADSDVRIAVPIGFINVDGSEWQEIAKIARANSTNFFVLGLPRSNEGNETQQSLYARNFAKLLTEKIPGAKVRLQDESLTSVVAEERLKVNHKNYAKGDIDAEAAAVILQDFIENFTVGMARQEQTESEDASQDDSISMIAGAKATAKEMGETMSNLAKKEGDKVKLNTKKARHKLKKATKAIIVVAIIITVIIGGGIWVNAMMQPVVADCKQAECVDIAFTVEEGVSKNMIANQLEEAGLIKNALIFKLYLQFSKPDANFRSGDYLLNNGLTIDEIISALEKGPNNDQVFTFTIRPGETIFDIKNNLAQLGYKSSEIEEAFQAKYDFEFLDGRPAGATLEGYLYGETHEFYNDTPVKEIIETFLKGMGEVIQENGLEARYKAQGLTLFEGITLASVVQKESSETEMPTVAQVFLTRIASGIPLGSDVTVSYALDNVDPNRETYADNQAALRIDSCYNTRLYAGLPCGPISNPGLAALLAVANPSDTAYLYFLTGDDGLMYYSYTEAEHVQKIATYCQSLCDVSL